MTPIHPKEIQESQGVGTGGHAPAADEYAHVRYGQGNWIGLEGDKEVQNWALMPVGRDTC